MKLSTDARAFSIDLSRVKRKEKEKEEKNVLFF